MAAPGFGFSVGDFIAGINLIRKAADALRTAGGATEEYQLTIVELQGLESVLSKVRALQPTPSNTHIVDQIQLLGLRCHLPLERFLCSIRKYESCLDNRRGGATSRLRAPLNAGRRIQWAVVVGDELAKLKRSIAVPLATIQLLVQMETLEQERAGLANTTDLQRKTDSLSSNVEELKAQISTIISKIDMDFSPVLQNISLQLTSSSKDITDTLQITKGAVQEANARHLSNERMLTDILSLVRLQAIRPTITPQKPGNVATSMPTNPTTKSSCLDPRILDERLEVALGAALQAIQKSITEVVLLILLVFPALHRVLRSLTALSRSPTMLLQDNIRLEDALGRVMSLPYEHFRYWPVLQARLVIEFKGVPGESMVQRKCFQIINIRNGDWMPNSRTWEHSVFPGAQLGMSMLYNKLRFDDQACPRCHTLGDTESSQLWVRCPFCSLVYQLHVSQIHQGNGATSLVLLEDKDIVIDGVEYLEGIARSDIIDIAELQHFRRIHLIGSQDCTHATTRGLEVHKPRGRKSFNLFASDASGSTLRTNDRNAHIPTQPRISLYPWRSLYRDDDTWIPESPSHVQTNERQALRAKFDLSVPPGALWTKIPRLIVSSEALVDMNESFEERERDVIVRRRLTTAKIRALIELTRSIRNIRWDEQDQQSSAQSA